MTRRIFAILAIAAGITAATPAVANAEPRAWHAYHHCHVNLTGIFCHYATR